MPTLCNEICCSWYAVRSLLIFSFFIAQRIWFLSSITRALRRGQRKCRHRRCLCRKATLKNSHRPWRKAGHFSKGEHVAVRIRGFEIAEFRDNPGQDSKISPRSSHPSAQKCCFHSECFYCTFWASSWRRLGSARKATRTLPNPGQDSKISPRSSHPSSQKCRHPRCLCIKATLENA